MCFLLTHAVWANSPGKNGTRTIATTNTVINQFTTITSAVSAGAGTITVASIAALSSGEATGGGALAAGDVILIYQARGASINTTDTPTYGDITAYGHAGNYEFQSVASVSGNDIGLAPLNAGASCGAGATKRTYSAGAQVIRVPQYASLTVGAGASVATNAWNGDTGGVLAMRVRDTLTVDGTITVSGLGFRGAPQDAGDRASGGFTNLFFASDANPAGGAKGEGIASGPGGTFGGVTLTFSNPGGNFDIGAPANGGGGGGSHNGGGGGGANAATSLAFYCTSGTATYTLSVGGTSFVWCGQGTMPSTVVGSVAWTLDPGYRANGNVLTAQPGGGRGGYTFSNSDQTATFSGPGITAWGGNRRQALGGWGGRPLAQDLPNRGFFGGGGGAGAANSGTNSGAGAPGGGIIFIEAGALAGTGAVLANGNTAPNTLGSHNDAPGGGGAGGSIILRAGSGSVGSMQANGGNGGNQLITLAEAEGPGGGGGGGIIAVLGAGGSQAASAGTGGTTTSSSLTEFPRNGATDGSAGLTGQAAPPLIFPVNPCAGLAITKNNNTDTLVAGATTTYTIVISNTGPAPANGSLFRDLPASGLSCSSVTCTSAINTTCAASVPAASVTIGNLLGGGIPINSFPANSTLTFQVGCGVTATGLPP